ncbi:early endosome antigen 1 isoform X2 [Diorhabda carinulata]|uniref:early endosome antigen 1 isoform X2 n=1 Tax=Diorhabda carinulata TaxID=1163345 RepID=UPI0025A0F5F7|nr:early endosome antigen 1 isoform X2 [Diorhabda carinulata]
MHHLYPLAKGDPLCPLGFHPQVRWPTRCKRCFRDYKEHGGKKRESDSNLYKDASTVSTPSLSWSTRDGESKSRNWMSSTNLSETNENNYSESNDFNSPSSWISTPDLANMKDDAQPLTTTVSISLPKRRIKPIDTGQRTVSDSYSLQKEKISTTFNRSDSLATRANKLRAIKESSPSPPKGNRIQIKEVKTISEEPTNHDVQFLIQVKAKTNRDSSQDSSDNDDAVSLAGTETTDTTLVDTQENELKEQLESIKKELETTKAKCDRLEREKSDILLRRLAAMESTTSKTSASEVLKLQQKCNELQQQLEDYRDEKRSLSLKVKELESDLENRPTVQEAQRIADDLRSKLLAAETLCEELMDENEDIKKELRDMEEQMDELQDNFREDQAVEYTSIKKDLDQTTKNCRILSFKLRKAERKAAQLEIEKAELEKKMKDITGSGTTLSQIEKIKELEQEIKVSNEVSVRLQKELDEAKSKISKVEDTKGPTKKKAPTLASIGKNPSTDGKVSRESLTRGGSQDDPVQLLRDLQDSLEREADLREQLKFAEEEAQNLRKKVSRIEDDNESLVLQLKKMANRARTRKLSPTNQKLSLEPTEKSDISEDDDPAEIKLQLELSEQEASVLRHKVEELEGDNHKLKSKIKELQEQASTKTSSKRTLLNSEKIKENSLLNQKLKVLEDETNDIRKKLIEKERDCERLHAELSLTQKRSKGMQKSKSLDLDQQTLDLRRQLQVIEQEASVLRNKVQSLEVENEKLDNENKKLALKTAKGTKGDKHLDKYIDQIASLEIEMSEKNEKIKSLEELLNITEKKDNVLLSKGDFKKFSQRTPKKISALTSKDQMRTMISDLEKEIGEILQVLKTNENEKIKLEEEANSKVKKVTYELEETKKKINNLIEELEDEKLKSSAAVTEKEALSITINKLKESLDKYSTEKSSLQTELDKLVKDKTKLSNDKKSLGEEISKLQANLKSSATKQNDLNTLTQKANSLEQTLEGKEKEIKKLKEDYNKITNEIEKERLKLQSLEKDQAKWEEEKKKLNRKIETLTTKINALETTIQQKDKLVKQLETNLEAEKELVSKTNKKVGELESAEIAKLKEELDRVNKSYKSVEEKLSKAQLENKNGKLENEKKIKEMEIDLQNERKKLDVLKANNEKEQKNKELATLKEKIKKLEQNKSGSPETKTLQKTISELEATITKEIRKYDELTAKYEILEEEHVITKAKLVMEKETLESQYKNLKRETEQLESELKTLRDTYNFKNDTWIKEKLELESKLKSRPNSIGSDSDRQRLKALLEEKQSEYDQLKKEYDAIHGQMDFMRKESDDLKKKLDDYDKVNKIQRNINADSSAMEKEIKQLRIRLNNLEKSKKSDLAELKMRYESQMNVVNGELQSLQNQLSRFKREKDTYKHMLEMAQKTIGDLKQSPKLPRTEPKTIHYDELEESKLKVATLEQQISCMEDELSEARLEASRLKTELVSERSSFEVRLSEMHSKINELEEEKVLNSGRTKVVGIRTRMELAWQKEREEQQRLLQETATLARDLRQTLFEVERERDKERLEAKRKLDQLKKASEEDQDENKKKVTELQCDLLELRDAHAKLRTTNEKLRREREKYDKEREEYRSIMNGKKKLDQQGDDRKINTLIEQMDTLKQLAPELFFSKENEAPYTPTPPRRTKSKSRETSPALERRETSMGPEEKQQQIQYIMQRLVHTTEDLRRFQRFSEDDAERERIRRTMGVRRATSTEHDNVVLRHKPDLRRSSGLSQGNLKRKSISLEHTIQTEQNIWTNDNSLSSLNSLDLHSDVESGRTRRDASLDSRLSTGSTQSDSGEKKKKKSLIGKLKKLTKSRSIDDKDPDTFPPMRPLSSKTNSGESMEDTKGSKKDLKERITGIFKKAGSTSRSNSVERGIEKKHETSSTQRPLVRNGSNGHLTTSSDTESSKSKSRRS